MKYLGIAGLQLHDAGMCVVTDKGGRSGGTLVAHGCLPTGG